MFKEYVTVDDFIIGCGDFCVENGLTSLKYGGTTDEGIYKVNEDDCEFLCRTVMIALSMVRGDIYKAWR